MSIFSWFKSAPAATANVATTVSNLSTVAQQVATASGDPQAIAIANIANAVLGSSSPAAAAAQVAQAANLGPIAPTSAQLQAAMTALVAAQNAYNNLLAQEKAVAAYNAAMKEASQSTEVVNTVSTIAGA